MAQATVMDKGLIVIPKEVRQQMGLERGDKLIFVTLGGTTSIFKALDDPIRQTQGFLKDEGTMVDFLEEKRKELEEEEKDLPPPLSER